MTRCSTCGFLMYGPGKLCHDRRVCCGHCSDNNGHGAACVALRYCSSCNRQFIGRGKVNSGGQLFCCGHCSGGRGHSQKCQSRLSAIANGEETFHAREEVSHRSRSRRRHFSADSSPRCHSGRSSIQHTPLCIICLRNTPTFECMPCHHCCICSNCRDGFNPVNCPMCRRMVTSVEEVYFS